MSEKIFTKQGLTKIKTELEELKKIKLPAVAMRISEAKELGDLSENAEYQEAKDEQGLIAKRIMELEEVLRNAVVADTDHINNTEVKIGNKVIAQSFQKTFEFEIVSTNEVNPIQGKISNESPLGQSFLGKRKGDLVEVVVPRGKIQYKIVDIQ